MKTRVIALSLLLVMVLALFAGCGNSGGNTNTAPPATQAPATDAQPSNEPSDEPPADVEDAPDDDGGIDFSTKVHAIWGGTGQAGSLSASLYENWMDLVTERSGGAITFDYMNNGVLGTEMEIFEQVQDGVIQMGGAGIAIYTNFSTLLEVYQLPFLITSYDTEWAAIQSPEYKALVKGTEDAIGSIYIHGVVDVGMRHFGMVNKPINTIDDIKGQKIRTASSELLIEALQRCGASPIVVGYTEVYTALQNGIVDGEDVNYMTAAVQNHGEVINYFSEIGMYPFPTFMCYNKEWADSLPDGYWDFMCETMDECMETFFTKTIVGAEEKFVTQLEDAGVAINQVSDIDAWKETVAPMYDEYLNNTDSRVADFIVAVQGISK